MVLPSHDLFAGASPFSHLVEQECGGLVVEIVASSSLFSL
jgi:hypothetical protein